MNRKKTFHRVKIKYFVYSFEEIVFLDNLFFFKCRFPAFCSSNDFFAGITYFAQQCAGHPTKQDAGVQLLVHPTGRGGGHNTHGGKNCCGQGAFMQG